MDSKGFIPRKVKRVINGDTFDLCVDIYGLRRIRIADMNAPEIGDRGYHSAAMNLRELIEGEKVLIQPKNRDRFGYLVADIIINNMDVKKHLKLT